ncbi:MAG TPA: hypothetical protein DIU05_02450 [Bacteroidetes bacterium]|nr:hypothetical protein [Bacteroidota bacterium]
MYNRTLSPTFSFSLSANTFDNKTLFETLSLFKKSVVPAMMCCSMKRQSYVVSMPFNTTPEKSSLVLKIPALIAKG